VLDLTETFHRFDGFYFVEKKNPSSEKSASVTLLRLVATVLHPNLLFSPGAVIIVYVGAFYSFVCVFLGQQDSDKNLLKAVSVPCI
jgi:hypothetical protein